MKRAVFLLGAAALWLPGVALAQTTNVDGLANAVVTVIRHAEKPVEGRDLSPDGVARAAAYVHYFQHLIIDGEDLSPDCLIAGADSNGSDRPRLTLEPLAKATGLELHQQFKTKEPEKAAAYLREQARGRRILICWRHGEIGELLDALGADRNALLPSGKWPDDVFCWMIILHYDDHGRLAQSRRVNEALMPGDVGTK